MAYVLIATENCGECARVKRFISKNNLNISTGKTDENKIKIFRRAGVTQFPVLINDNGSSGFTIMANGVKTGSYIAENIEKFK